MKQKQNELSKNNKENSIEIKNKNSDNSIKISDDYIEYYKILNPTSDNPEKEVVENKILSQEAKQRGIEISYEELAEINSLKNSNEIFKDAIDDKKKEELKDTIYEYLLDIEYSSKLQEQIISEISNYKISIQNEELNKLLEEYKQLQENAKNIDDSEKENKFKEIYLKYSQIENLYYKTLYDNYDISY